MKRLALWLAALLLVALPCCALPQRGGRAELADAAVTDAAVCGAQPDAAGREALAYFAEVAFGSEYGPADDCVRKWNRPVLLAVGGEPTREDMETLGRVMDSLNAVQGFPGIRLVERGQNMNVLFVPLKDMPDAVPGYVQGNWGFFTVRFSRGAIARANVAIASDVTDQQARNHLLFEEIIQSAGIMRDSALYEDSIFYSRWTTVQQPSGLDWELVRMLYRPELTSGMPKGKALGILQQGPATPAPDTQAAPRRLRAA